jgi:hypothetical protein
MYDIRLDIVAEEVLFGLHGRELSIALPFSASSLAPRLIVIVASSRGSAASEMIVVIDARGAASLVQSQRQVSLRHLGKLAQNYRGRAISLSLSRHYLAVAELFGRLKESKANGLRILVGLLEWCSHRSRH